jgi:hypothetical protein
MLLCGIKIGNSQLKIMDQDMWNSLSFHRSAVLSDWYIMKRKVIVW